MMWENATFYRRRLRLQVKTANRQLRKTNGEGLCTVLPGICAESRVIPQKAFFLDYFNTKEIIYFIHVRFNVKWISKYTVLDITECNSVMKFLFEQLPYHQAKGFSDDRSIMKFRAVALFSHRKVTELRNLRTRVH